MELDAYAAGFQLCCKRTALNPYNDASAVFLAGAGAGARAHRVQELWALLALC